MTSNSTAEKTLMRLRNLIFVALAITVIVNWSNSSCLQTSLSCLLNSSSVKTVFKEAQNASHRTVTVKPFSSRGLYSGYTDFDAGPEISIQIDLDLPYQVAQNNLIHELYHVILGAQGFQFTAGSRKFNEPGDIGSLYTATGKQLINCYVDPLIDQQMAKKGFHPEFVTKISADGLAATNKEGILRSSAWNPMWTNYAALELYCLSLRPGTFHIQDVEKTYSVVPLIINKENELRHTLGKPSCATATLCYEALIALRNASGFNPDILVLNPKTKKYE